jgi:protein O-mannosyl-transferase
MIPRDVEARPGGGRSYRAPALAVLLGVLCYANSWFNGFTYDDVPIVERNPRIRSLTNFREIWLTDWWLEQTEDQPFPDPQRDRLYRPLTLYSFALNYALNGLNPAGYHAVNVALHALVCVLVWLFVRRLFDDDWIAGLTAVLFAVHPVHAEAVAGIVGRGEILSAGFLLGALLILLPRPGPPGAKRVWLSLPFFMAALLAKETAVCYPAVALLIIHAAYGFKKLSIRGWLWRAALLAIPLAIYLPLRYYAMGGHLIRTKIVSILFMPLLDADWFGRIHGPLTILGHYARLILVPDKFACDYGPAVFDPRKGPEFLTLVGLVLALGILIALRGYFRPGVTGRRLAILAAVFLASYLLISNTVLLIGTSSADRLMYWPSAPLLAAIAVGVSAARRWYASLAAKVPERATWIRLGGILLVAALGLRSAVRSADWKDNATLFVTDRNAYPQNAYLNCGSAGLLIMDAHLLALKINEITASVLEASPPLEETKRAEKQRQIQQLRAAELAALDQAESYVRDALEVEARYPDAHIQLGKIAIMRDDPDAARRHLQSGLLLNPGDLVAQGLLTRLEGSSEKLEERTRELTRQIEAQPADVPTRLELARALITLGQAPKAAPHAEAAARLQPNNIEALKLYAETLLLNMQKDQAAEIYRKILALDPNDWEAHSNLTTLSADSDPAATMRHALRAYELRPNDLRIQINLAEAYELNGRRDEALAQFRQTLRGLPENHPQRSLILERIEELANKQP